MQIDLSPDHEYTIDGVPVVGVTSVLNAILGDPTNGWGDAYHLAQGSAAHELYAMMARGEDLGLYDYDQRLIPFVKSWQSWLAAERPDGFEVIEHRVGSATRGYAGTLDAVPWIRRVLVMIDYKANSKERDRIQLGAYHLAWREMGNPPCRELRSLRINADGWRYGCRVKGIDIRLAEADWLACLRVYRLREGI